MLDNLRRVSDLTANLWCVLRIEISVLVLVVSSRIADNASDCPVRITRDATEFPLSILFIWKIVAIRQLDRRATRAVRQIATAGRATSVTVTAIECWKARETAGRRPRTSAAIAAAACTAATSSAAAATRSPGPWILPPAHAGIDGIADLCAESLSDRRFSAVQRRIGPRVLGCARHGC